MITHNHFYLSIYQMVHAQVKKTTFNAQPNVIQYG